MSYTDLIYIPLDRAYLCSDCKCVGNQSAACPACTSTHIQSLAGIMDRETSSEEQNPSPQGDDGRSRE